MRIRNLYPVMIAGIWTAATGAEALAADAVAGEAVFREKCNRCHELDAHKVCPKLRGVHGRQAGSTDYDGYLGLRRARFFWNEALLNEFLTDPKAFVKAYNRRRVVGMGVFVESEQERADVIEYLKTQN